jgi:hypothetical protein
MPRTGEVAKNTPKTWRNDHERADAHYDLRDHQWRVRSFICASFNEQRREPHGRTNVIPVCQHTKKGTGLTALPWVVALFGAMWWRYWYDRAKSRHENFLRNSPGKPVETDDIQHGPGHPV